MTHEQVLTTFRVYRLFHRKGAVTKSRLTRVIGKNPPATYISALKALGIQIVPAKDKKDTWQLAK